MKEELKLYCESEYRNARHFSDGWLRAIDRAYGAVVFFLCTTCTTEADKEEIMDWWENDMREKFYALQRLLNLC